MVAMILSAFVTLANANVCKEIVYEGQDFEAMADHGNDMSQACDAAEKAATWSACVTCQGDAERTDVCYAAGAKSRPDLESNECEARALAKSSACTAPGLVHCERFLETE